VCVYIKNDLFYYFFLIRLNNLLSGELMSKDLIKVASKLESIGLPKEAELVRSVILKSASSEPQLDKVGILWAVYCSDPDYGNDITDQTLLTTKEAAEELAEHKSESSIQYGVKEVEVYRLKRL
jgi:hypothetical protein